MASRSNKGTTREGSWLLWLTFVVVSWLTSEDPHELEMMVGPA